MVSALTDVRAFGLVMENLAHTFVGLVIGKAGFERYTKYAVPVCAVAANLPDADIVTLYGGAWFYLHHHRGITHSLVGVVVLAVLLAALFYLFGKARGLTKDKVARRDSSVSDAGASSVKSNANVVRFVPLLLASLAASLSHPLLDWTNNYGIRPLLPFSRHWFYGDLVFIVDPYIWLSIGGAAFLLTAGKKRSVAIWTVIGGLLTAAILYVPWRSGFYYPRTSHILWLLGIGGLIVAYKFKLAARFKHKLAIAALCNLVLYWGVLSVVHAHAVKRGERVLARTVAPQGVSKLAATPTLANPWRWQCLAETESRTYRFGLDLNDDEEKIFDIVSFPTRFDEAQQQQLNRAKQDERAQVLLDFARFPVYGFSRNCLGQTIVQFADLRYTEPNATTRRGNFRLEVEVDD